MHVDIRFNYELGYYVPNTNYFSSLSFERYEEALLAYSIWVNLQDKTQIDTHIKFVFKLVCPESQWAK